MASAVGPRRLVSPFPAAVRSFNPCVYARAAPARATGTIKSSFTRPIHAISAWPDSTAILQIASQSWPGSSSRTVGQAVKLHVVRRPAGDVDAQHRQDECPFPDDTCPPANQASTIPVAAGRLELQFLFSGIAVKPRAGLSALDLLIGGKAGRQPVATLQAFVRTTAGRAKRLAGEEDATLAVKHRDEEAGALQQLKPRGGWYAARLGHTDGLNMPSI